MKPCRIQLCVYMCAQHDLYLGIIFRVYLGLIMTLRAVHMTVMTFAFLLLKHL